ncbi:MAG TPA: FAD-dependent oxidoreductase [Candidatus Eisenbacteria bacterium]
MPRRERLDALILGGGMAGISAALTLKGFGLSLVVLEEGLQPGGQLHEIHAPIHDYPLAFGLTGTAFVWRLANDARAAGIPILAGVAVGAVSLRRRWIERDGERFEGRTLLLATGLRRRALGVPGERELRSRGVSVSANRDRMLYAGKPVVVVGGGTGAVEDALLCAGVGSPVTLLHRSTRFRARTDFLERARQHPQIRIVPNASIRRILGETRVEEVQFRVRGSGTTRRVPAAGVFVRIGWEPRTELVRGQMTLDRAGYVKAGPGGRTGIPGVFAAGDICSPRCLTLANAAGQGTAAAWEMARLLGRVKG